MKRLIVFITFFWSVISVAETQRADWDIDDDGLIEINDLDDLDSIRNHLNGTGLHGETRNCYSENSENRICKGFELTTNLDFDSNADGILNEHDAYWNGGAGWVPIGNMGLSDYDSLSAEFDGNGNIIRNLHVNGIQSGIYSAGLFSVVENSTIHNLGLSGDLTSVKGILYAGAIAGVSFSSVISEIQSSVNVEGELIAGGIVGGAGSSDISNVASSGSVTATIYSAGIVGVIADNTYVNFALATGNVSLKPLPPNMSTDVASGGIVAETSGYYSINYSYWARDLTGQSNSMGSGVSYGLLSNELVCPTHSNDTQCTNITLFNQWSEEHWEFGTNQSLPSLNLEFTVYKDSDDDGVIDKYDAFPTNFATSIDHDLDGIPDHWNVGCNTQCQTESGQELDAFLEDTDNDGLTNNFDSDDNGDGFADVDSNSNGLIEIYTLQQLNAIRNRTSGEALEIQGEIKRSGCPITISGKTVNQACLGYELMNDLNFDSNQDGILSEEDSYWNEGMGWEPIQSAFVASFNGNGHKIKNLMINRPDLDKVGLFSELYGGEIKGLSLTGSSMNISGRNKVGSFAGYASNDSRIFESFSIGTISGQSEIGGLVGGAAGLTIKACFTLGDIQGAAFVGRGHGLKVYASFTGGPSRNTFVGEVPNMAVPSGQERQVELEVKGSYSTRGAGPFYEMHFNPYLIEESYFPVGTELVDEIEKLKCPTIPSDSSCASDRFSGWNSFTDDNGIPYWDFGDSDQLPGLRLNGVVYRDADGDGVLDEM